MYIHKHAVLHRVLYPKAHINRFQKKKKKKKSTGTYEAGPLLGGLMRA